ncbi:MAG: S8 family serine peptidase [Bacteroidales bacterium]
MKGGSSDFRFAVTAIPKQNVSGCVSSGYFPVSALDLLSTRAGYSNYGTWVTISAPGGDSDDNALPGSNTTYKNGIMSTLDKNGYGYLDGTSMACPHVSGIAGLVVSKYGGPDFTNTALKNHLITG